LENLGAENDYGKTEYKLKLDNPTLDRVDHLTTQMIWRLNEGFGHAVYRLGIEDNGNVQGITEEEMKDTLAVLFYMARNQNAKIEI
jgi:GTPase